LMNATLYYFLDSVLSQFLCRTKIIFSITSINHTSIFSTLYKVQNYCS
jgi:hypothetical protein